MEWIRKHPIGAAFLFVGGLLVVGLLLSSLGSGGSTEEAVVDTSDDPNLFATETTAETAGVNPDVPQVDCDPLITIEEVDVALDVVGESAGLVSYGGGEACADALGADESFFVRIEPGEPGDFEAGAELLGVTASPVSGIGDESVWFGGGETEVGTSAGVLSVRQETSLGLLHYRIVVGRPDLDSDAQLEIAKTLALTALPRFPGVVQEPTEPTVITIEKEPVDLSNLNYVQNLLAREEAGDWTRGEGLVMTLRYFAGDVGADEVLLHPELVDYSGTGTLLMARQYLVNGPDVEAKAEISRLLELVAPSREQLEQMAGIGPAEVSLRHVSMGPTLQEDTCESLGLGPSPCVAQLNLPELETDWPGKFALFTTLGEAGDWSLTHAEWTIEAMVKFAETLGAPTGHTITVFLSPTLGVHTQLDFQEGDHCQISLGNLLPKNGKGEFQQKVAAELARCSIGSSFRKWLDLQSESQPWWFNGLAIYLSGVVYPSVNLEWKSLPATLSGIELETTLFTRESTNWVFFEDEPMRNMDGVVKNMNMVEQEIKVGLGEIAGMDEKFHTFEQHLTDSSVVDFSGGQVPYQARAWPIEISGPTIVVEEPLPFGVTRFQLTVTPGQYACVEFEIGEFVQASWREGKPGLAGGWSAPPEVLSGDSLVLVTAVKPGGVFTMNVKKVQDDPDCEEEEQDPEECEMDALCESSDYYWSDLVPIE